ncbi:hypothetical protein ACFY9Q_01240 [Streptomyces sp. NPDC012389]|uniref:hypothetical protein n=1 Tax=Streptomyces sp. NPDC012389 TaxID=3364830 RepID=UPI0036E3FD95
MARSRGTTPTRRCPGCGTTLITQWVGRVAALRVTAATTPITPREEAELRTPNRLTWCLVTGPHRAPELRSRCPSRACTHTVVIEHHCQPEPTTLF